MNLAKLEPHHLDLQNARYEFYNLHRICKTVNQRCVRERLTGGMR